MKKLTQITLPLTIEIETDKSCDGDPEITKIIESSVDFKSCSISADVFRENLLGYTIGEFLLANHPEALLAALKAELKHRDEQESRFEPYWTKE